MTDDWVDKLYAEIDSGDIKRLENILADDIEVRMANSPPINGRQAVLELTRAFWSELSGMRHRKVELVEQGDKAVLIADVTYILRDKREVTLPVASHIRRNSQGRLTRLWMYIDLAPFVALTSS